MTRAELTVTVQCTPEVVQTLNAQIAEALRRFHRETGLRVCVRASVDRNHEVSVRTDAQFTHIFHEPAGATNSTVKAGTSAR